MVKKEKRSLKNLRKEDEREGEEKKERRNDRKSNPPSSHPTRVLLVEIHLDRGKKSFLLVTDLHARVDVGAEAGAPQQEAEGGAHQARSEGQAADGQVKHRLW